MKYTDNETRAVVPVEISTLKPLITVGEAVALGIGSHSQIRRMCQKGHIKATKVGTDWRINRDALLEQFGLA